MPARDGRSSRRRARTLPEHSPESGSDHGAGEAANSDRGRVKRGGQGAAPHGGGAATGSTKSGTKDTIQATNAEKPELLSRFIPPDPLIGRVSLSSPQRPISLLGPIVSTGTVVSSSSSPVVIAGGMGGSSERGARFRQGAVGLENDGNSCYLNATLQVLARCTPLRTHLVECAGRRNSTNISGRPCPLALAMSQLYGGMWSSEGGDDAGVESAENVLRALVKGNRWFAGFGQHDAHEALRSVLDLLHEELRRPVPASFEPGYAALTAAIAASSAQQSRTLNGSVNGDAQPQPQPPPDKSNVWGEVTTPCTPAGDGAWSENGDVDGEGRAEMRAVTGDRAAGPPHEVYWQSAAAETFQGILLGRITCRACGRHSEQPDRFYDLSLPLLPVAAEAKPRSPPPPPPASGGSAGLEAANTRRRDGTSVSPTVESPAPEWEPTPTPTPCEERRGSGVVGTEGGDGESAAGDRSSDWGAWRRQRGGWCMASVQRAQERGSDEGDKDGERGEGGRRSTSVGYVRGLFSSVRVWLGINSVPLEDCMQAFFSTERLRGANQYHCESCGSKKEADKVIGLLHAPEVLVLHLKRFRRGFFWSHKVHNRVVFPLHDLDVSPWLADHAVELQSRPPASGGGNGGDAHRKSSMRRGSYLGGGRADGGSASVSANGTTNSPRGGACAPSPSPVLYDLVGLVQHTGGLEHGHYTCYARDDGSAAWYHFNDTVVDRVSQDVVASAIPYILIYRRKKQSARGTPHASSISSSASTVTNAPTISHLAAAGIGPAVEEARDVRSRVELMAREMAKAAGHSTPSRSSIAKGSSSAGGKEGGADAGIDGAGQNSVAGVGGGGGGGVSDTDGEGGGGMAAGRTSVGRRRKGRGRRPGSESESEGGAGPRSWVYMSKAWALKWATCAYPGPVSNHHVVCRHGRVKPNVGVKRAAKEVVAVPRGVHRSLVNRYGPRTPAIGTKPSILDANGGYTAVATTASSRAAAFNAVGRGASDLALVGSSRPLLELVSCTACKALDEELSKVKGAEQTEVARLSRIGQERRKNRKLTRQRREKKRRSSLDNGCDGVRKGAEREGMGYDVGDAAASQRAEEGGLVTTEAGGEGTDADGPGNPEDRRHNTDEDSHSESEEWFLMAGTWISRWHAYILSGAGEDLDFATPPPGPITNGDLVDEDGNPFPGKEAGESYRGAMLEVWKYLHERYGGGPVIKRSDPDGLYQGAAVEPPPS